MSDFSNDYENLKNQLNDDKGKLIGYLFAGLIIGRLYEKLNNTKKKIFKKFKLSLIHISEPTRPY